MAKPVTETISEQIKRKQEEQAEKITKEIEEQIEQMQGLPLPGPKKKPKGYIADPDEGIDYHWIPDEHKKVSELVEIKNDAERHNKLRLARDMAATKARNYGNKARGVERRRSQNNETEAEKTLYLNTKENLQKYYKNTETYNEAEGLPCFEP